MDFGAVVVIWLVMAALCAYLAHIKGKNPTGWFLWGLALGIFALLKILFEPIE